MIRENVLTTVHKDDPIDQVNEILNILDRDWLRKGYYLYSRERGYHNQDFVNNRISYLSVYTPIEETTPKQLK